MNLVPELFPLLFQVATFLVLWICLKRLLFDPLMQVIELRRQRTVGARAHAEELMAIVERDREEYEQSIHAARARLAQESDAARNAAQQESAALLAKERSQAAEKIAQLRDGLKTQVDQARQVLAGEAEAIATEMLARVTGGTQA